MGFKQYVSVREDVLDPAYDEKLAPEIDEIVFGTAPRIYLDPREFFERTYLTNTLKIILMEIGRVLSGRGGHKVYPILAFFGGGKTHTLLTIYHSLMNPQYTGRLSKEIYSLYKDIRGIEVIVVYGKDSRLSPSPLKPLVHDSIKIKTLWGYIADILGKYRLVARDDQMETCPDLSVIRSLLRDRKVVILIDEILEYIDTLYVKGKTGYIRELIKFFDRLAQAVEATNNILVVTIAAEKKPTGEIETQRRYEEIQKIVEDLLDALMRTAGNIYAPVSTQTELYGVLKKRLFKEVRRDEALGELNALFRVYHEYGEVFGDTHHLETQILEAYPFHPSYLDILRLIAEKVSGNRTRFAMRVTRTLLRRLIESSDDPVLVMPWHIDPIELGISGLFFVGDYSGYHRIYEAEIKNIENKITNPAKKPLLIKTILKTIFLSTYPYDSLTVKPVFPTSKEIARMVFEPVFYRQNNYSPTDILDALSSIKVSEYVRFLHYDENSDRYWYSRITSIKEWIIREARRLLEDNRTAIENKLVDNIGKLLHVRLVEVGDNRYGREPFESAEVFDRRNMYVYKTVHEADVPDDNAYKLVAILYDDPDRIPDLIYRYNSNERVYANTVVVVTVSTRDKVNALLDYQAKLEATKKVMEQIDELYRGYDKEIREIEKTMANSQQRAFESLLLSSILSFFDKIYYPIVKNSAKTVDVAYASSSDKSIAERVVSTLSASGISKIVRSITFDALRTYLARVGLEIKPGTRLTVETIINTFRMRPELPMVKKDRILDALRDGVKKLEIGLISEFNQLYFKNRYRPDDIEAHMGRDTGVNIVGRIREVFTVIHWRDALDILLKQIEEDISKNNNVEVDGGIQRIEYLIFYEGNKYPLQAIRNYPNWEEILRYGFIVRKVQVIRRGLTVKAQPNYLEVSPTDKPRIEIIVEPLGGYSGSARVRIDPDYAVIDHGDLEGTPPFETWVILDASKLGGVGTITVIVEDDRGNIYEDIVSVRLKKKKIEADKPGILRRGDKLLYIRGSITGRNIHDVLDYIDKLGQHINTGDELIMYVSEFRISIRSNKYGESTIEFKQADPAVVSYIVSELVEALGSLTSINGSLLIDFKEEITLTETLKRLLDEMIKNTELIVAVERVEE